MGLPRIHHLGIFALGCCLSFAVACKSAPTKAETLKAEQNLDDIADAADGIDDEVQKSTASPAVKASVQKKTQDIKEKAGETKKTVESQGVVIDKMTAEIQGLNETIGSLKIYRALVWGFCACIGLAAAGFGIKKLFF